MEFFDWLQLCKDETAIASGGFDFFVSRIAKDLGVKHWIANKVRAIEGKVDGFEEPVVDANAKRIFVERLQKELGVTPLRTVVIGNGWNDLEMMRAAGLRIGFNAKPAVALEADIVIEPDFRLLSSIVALYRNILDRTWSLKATSLLWREAFQKLEPRTSKAAMPLGLQGLHKLHIK